MRKRYFLIVLTAMLVWSCGQQRAMRGSMVVAFYNVENLFDTIDNPNKIDEEFTPQSEKMWNTERYWKKVDDLSRVISSIEGGNLPVLLGLCEIENDQVLNDLAAQQVLKKNNYQIVWNEGPDLRGIDCALMYNPRKFKLSNAEFIPVIHPEDTSFTTREIVYATGSIKGEQLHVFVNHWPSRRGGEDASAPLRNKVAHVLRAKIDSLFQADVASNIIVMGDLNDEPSDSSVLYILKALPNDRQPQSGDLVNLMHDESGRGEGSYNFRGNWNMIDHLIVSGNLINKRKGIRTTLDNGFIFHLPFMEYTNEQGVMSPSRTYGRSYFGGISDHFPVYMILKK